MPPRVVPSPNRATVTGGNPGGGMKVGMGRVGSGLRSGPGKGKEGVIGGIEVRGVGLGADYGKGVGKDAG